MNHGNNEGEGNAVPQDCEARLAAVKLSPPKLPPAAAILPERRALKYPAFQELAAMKQEIQDEFSKGRLALGDIKGRFEEDSSVVSGRGDTAVPLAAPQENPHPSSFIPHPSPAAVPAVSRAVRQAAPEKAAPPAAARGRGRAAVFAVLALCAVVFAMVRFYAGDEASAYFPLPPTSAAGLCLSPEGGRVFFSDPQRQLLFEISASYGRVKSVQSFPAAGLKGLAFDGASFWSSDGAVVSRHGASGGYAVQGVYKAAGASLICWHAGKLWAAAPGGELRSYLAGESLAEDGVYPMPSGRTAGISVTAGVLWLFDPVSGKLSGYKLSAKPELMKTADLKPWLPQKGSVSGFALGGSYIWLVTENPAGLVRLSLKRVRFYSGRD